MAFPGRHFAIIASCLCRRDDSNGHLLKLSIAQLVVARSLPAIVNLNSNRFWFGFVLFYSSFDGQVWPELTGSYLCMVFVPVNWSVTFCYKNMCLTTSCCSGSCWSCYYMTLIPYYLSKIKNKTNSIYSGLEGFSKGTEDLHSTGRIMAMITEAQILFLHFKFLYFAFVLISHFGDFEFSPAE